MPVFKGQSISRYWDKTDPGNPWLLVDKRPLVKFWILCCELMGWPWVDPKMSTLPGDLAQLRASMQAKSAEKNEIMTKRNWSRINNRQRIGWNQLLQIEGVSHHGSSNRSKNLQTSLLRGQQLPLAHSQQFKNLHQPMSLKRRNKQINPPSEPLTRSAQWTQIDRWIQRWFGLKQVSQSDRSSHLPNCCPVKSSFLTLCDLA